MPKIAGKVLDTKIVDGYGCKGCDRWAEKAKLIVNSMALIGYNEFYEDSPADMEDGEIEAYIWRKIALNMLKNIKFPAELYQICNAIACMSDDKLEEMLK